MLLVLFQITTTITRKIEIPLNMFFLLQVSETFRNVRTRMIFEFKRSLIRETFAEGFGETYLRSCQTSTIKLLAKKSTVFSPYFLPYRCVACTVWQGLKYGPDKNFIKKLYTKT